MTRARCLIVLLDGLGDRPSVELKKRTPLMYARKPFIDRLSREGVNGLMDPVGPGIPVGSDTGHLAILGYDPYKYYTGRGPFEALGAGIRLEPGDVAFRYNLATVDENWRLIDRRAGRISTEEAEVLADSLRDLAADLSKGGVEVIIRSTVEHRGVLVLRGPSLSHKVTDVDPHKENVTVEMPRPTEASEGARRTAQILAELIKGSHALLTVHELNRDRVRRGMMAANALLTRGGGVMPNLYSLNERFKIRSSVIAGGALYKGVCGAAGMEVVNVEGATGTLKTNLAGKFRAARDRLRVDDLVFLHIKGTDSASHDRSPASKAQFIERVDEEFSRAFGDTPSGLVICVTGDHTTSSITGEHRGDPVPLLIWGDEVRRDGVESFDEVNCSKGGLNRLRGLDLMNVLLDVANVTEMFGE
ncbi:MAG: 2,3-bisphosphoglycerate-independent phosphoglycerate mutase [Aigarchaeota archaeon]|nr:2,3-bisphosphoglycerate-independent phosphoglycerate mutase [Aigarchaeota archaeon]MDW8093114.1 2,3-bisphosphoglycerate-independent phosphoglycerate mutase [Nitrososphaerota archaeon]